MTESSQPPLATVASELSRPNYRERIERAIREVDAKVRLFLGRHPLCDRVLALYQQHPAGLTADEVSVLLGTPRTASSPRVAELLKRGVLVNSGERRLTRTGKKRAWVLKLADAQPESVAADRAAGEAPGSAVSTGPNSNPDVGATNEPGGRVHGGTGAVPRPGREG